MWTKRLRRYNFLIDSSILWYFNFPFHDQTCYQENHQLFWYELDDQNIKVLVTLHHTCTFISLQVWNLFEKIKINYSQNLCVSTSRAIGKIPWTSLQQQTSSHFSKLFTIFLLCNISLHTPLLKKHLCASFTFKIPSILICFM